MAANLHGMFARRLAAVAVFMVVTAVSAYAQQAAGDIIVAWGERLKRFLSVLMGIAALVSIAFSIYYMLNGKSEAAKKLVDMTKEIGGKGVILECVDYANYPEDVRQVLKAALMR